jgi:hypothetical protein
MPQGLRFCLSIVVLVLFSVHSDAQAVILHTRGSTYTEKLAASEIRKYVYQRTDSLLTILESDILPDQGEVILLARDDHPLVESFRSSIQDTCSWSGFILKSIRDEGRNILVISGFDCQAVLYGAYRFAEHLGVRFDLAGDILPDAKITLDISGFDEKSKPLLQTRGIQPFHDFFQGPDFWSSADYLSVISQLPKLGMNFIGLHTYPTWSNTEEKLADVRQGPESTVWIGLEEDINPDGTVNWAYPSFYAHTQRPSRIWGYDTLGTNLFHAGADQLFAGNGFGSEIFDRAIPSDPESSKEVFNRTGQMFEEAFGHAKELNVKTAIGTELPLGLEPKGHSVLFDWARVMPPALQERLISGGSDPVDPEVVKEVYKGIFTRIMKTHPLDYYWLWSWEVWSMHDPASKKQIKAFKDDIRIAYEALQELGSPFQLGLAGWIIGTVDDHAVFDDVLPSEAPFFGLWDEADGFQELSPERVKWPATWLEEDWGLIQPQLELDRIYNDIKAAILKNCHGMIAKHWRTRALGGNVASMKDLLWTYTKTGSSFSNIYPENRSDWIDTFYKDWANQQFGPDAAEEIATIFASLDKTWGAIPSVSGWDTDMEDAGSGPGAIMPNDEPWSTEQEQYGFVGELEALREEILGNGNLERFDYWLKTFQSLKIMGEYGCVRYQFENAMEEENWSRALEHRITLARLFEQIITLQTEKIVNVSDLGEIVNLEILNWQQLMELQWGKQLSERLGIALPPESYPSKEYTGRSSVKVLTRQTQILKGDPLELKVLIVGEHSDPVMTWRPLGSGAFQSIPLTHVERGVYRITIPEAEHDFEYAIQAQAGPDTIVYPASAPHINQVVIVQDNNCASCRVSDPAEVDNTEYAEPK